MHTTLWLRKRVLENTDLVKLFLSVLCATLVETQVVFEDLLPGVKESEIDSKPAILLSLKSDVEIAPEVPLWLLRTMKDPQVSSNQPSYSLKSLLAIHQNVVLDLCGHANRLIGPLSHMSKSDNICPHSTTQPEFAVRDLLCHGPDVSTLKVWVQVNALFYIELQLIFDVSPTVVSYRLRDRESVDVFVFKGGVHPLCIDWL